MDSREEVLNLIRAGLGHEIRETLPRGIGFTLFLFHEGEADGFMSYMSTARREDMLTMLVEFIEKETKSQVMRDAIIKRLSSENFGKEREEHA